MKPLQKFDKNRNIRIYMVGSLYHGLHPIFGDTITVCPDTLYHLQQYNTITHRQRGFSSQRELFSMLAL